MTRQLFPSAVFATSLTLFIWLLAISVRLQVQQPEIVLSSCSSRDYFTASIRQETRAIALRWAFTPSASKEPDDSDGDSVESVPGGQRILLVSNLSQKFLIQQITQLLEVSGRRGYLSEHILVAVTESDSNAAKNWSRLLSAQFNISAIGIEQESVRKSGEYKGSENFYWIAILDVNNGRVTHSSEFMTVCEWDAYLQIPGGLDQR